MSEQRLKEIALELEALDREVDANYKKQSQVQQEASDLKEQEMKLRSELIFLKKILCKKPWTYDSDSRFSGRYDDYFKDNETLGRLDDYHTRIQLEEFVDLIISDGDIYLRFSSLYPELDDHLVKEKMKSFVKRWGISLEVKNLEEKRQRRLAELKQIEQLLKQLEELQQ